MAGHTNSDGNEAANTIDRRQFVASLTTAGAVATIGGMTTAAEHATRNEQAATAQGDDGGGGICRHAITRG